MPRYFSLDRIQAACDHLDSYNSKWVIVPLVFAVNGVNALNPVDLQAAGRAGTDRFLDTYFNGSRIGLPPHNQGGNNSLRPKFSEITVIQGDHVVHQAQRLWGSAYSSRGYREMTNAGLVTVVPRATFTLVQPQFVQNLESRLPASFHFEELLVWLFAFEDLPADTASWTDLFVRLQERHLGNGRQFPAEYLSRFNVANNVAWPTDFLAARPSNQDYQRALLPSRFAVPTVPPAVAPVGRKALRMLPDEFNNAVTASGLNFGDSQDELVRTFCVSVLTRPFVILSGLSGSGKTQLALKLGEWLAPKRFSVIAVRPDWGSSEAMFGYENMLDLSTPREWVVAEPLQLMLKAASDPVNPYLLVLDEMNLAHIERYFGDFLSGFESGTAVLPNLECHEDGKWRLKAQDSPKIPIPQNLIVIGTVNVDETTYMFSPKVLDRAQVIEFRVTTDSLGAWKVPQPAAAAPADSSAAFLAYMQDQEWHGNFPTVGLDEYKKALAELHSILARDGFEFGHRTYRDALRFVSMFEGSGGTWQDALDRVVYQKVLTRLNGSMKRVGNCLRAVSSFCLTLNCLSEADAARFDPSAVNADEAKLRESFAKSVRMDRVLRLNHFVSFTE